MKIEKTPEAIHQTDSQSIEQKGDWQGRSITTVAGLPTPIDQDGYQGKPLHERKISVDSGTGSMASLVDFPDVKKPDSEERDIKLPVSQAIRVKNGLEKIGGILGTIGVKSKILEKVTVQLEQAKTLDLFSCLEDHGMADIGQSMVSDIITLLNQSLETPVDSFEKELKEALRFKKEYKKISDKITQEEQKLFRSDKPNIKKMKQLDQQRETLKEKSLYPALQKLDQAIYKTIDESPVLKRLTDNEARLKKLLPEKYDAKAAISNATRAWCHNLVYDKATNK